MDHTSRLALSISTHHAVYLFPVYPDTSQYNTLTFLLPTHEAIKYPANPSQEWLIVPAYSRYPVGQGKGRVKGATQPAGDRRIVYLYKVEGSDAGPTVPQCPRTCYRHGIQGKCRAASPGGVAGCEITIHIHDSSLLLRVRYKVKTGDDRGGGTCTISLQRFCIFIIQH